MMRLFTLLAVAGLGLGLLASTGEAHHSTNNMYHEDQIVEVTGTVVEWRLVNPHPFLIISVTEANGDVHEYDVSFGGSAAGPLRRQGYTPESFRAGETVLVRGNPASTEGAYGVLVRGREALRREDGTPVP